MDYVIAHNNKQILEHGNTPQGVGWNSDMSQKTRFDQIAKILSDVTGIFSINDYGCGYGAFLDYLMNRYESFQYKGYYVSKSMLSNCRNRTNHYRTDVEIHLYDTKDIRASYYTVASGVFRMKFDFDNSVWLSYIKDTLDIMSMYSTKGFTFNLLTKYTDLPDLDEELYYTDSCQIFDYCKRKSSRICSVVT